MGRHKSHYRIQTLYNLPSCPLIGHNCVSLSIEFVFFSPLNTDRVEIKVHENYKKGSIPKDVVEGWQQHTYQSKSRIVQKGYYSAEQK